jgi:peroxiredoxin Q/BCP
MRRFGLGVLLAAGLLLPPVTGPGAAAPPGSDSEYTKLVHIKVGDDAPAFQCLDDQGATWKSKQHFGKKIVVLYFYMGDFFKDCTWQNCNYRDDLRKLKAEGAEVVGVSGDSPENHQKFKKAYQLTQTLLCDPKGELCDLYGVWTSGGGDFKAKDAFGELTTIARGCTPTRWTFVIGRDGKVIYKNTSVKAKEDSREVLAAIAKHNEALRDPKRAER